MPRVRFGSRSYELPGNRIVRTALGVTFILFGAVGFLPVLGFWMIPVGLLVLSADSPSVRRLNRRATVRIVRAWHAFRGRARPAQP